MRVVICAIAALSVAACATTPVPNMRPLNEAQIAAIGPTRVVIAESDHGVAKSWFMQDSSAAGASYGLIGALVTATMDAIMNAAPSRRARRAADEIAEVMPVAELNTSLTEQFRGQIVATTPPPPGIVVSEVSTVRKLSTPGVIDDAVEVATSYVLSEDASTLRIVAAVTYQNAAVPYATPYTFEGSVPKAETMGPVYRNVFTYYSQQLPVPTLTPELQARLVESIQDSARDDAGVLPVEGTDAFKAMNKELEQARDGEFTKGEIAIFLAREWAKDDGALLKAELDSAEAFITRYVLLDMNQTAVPSFQGETALVETLADGRTIRRVGAGLDAGSYISSPANVSSFATYGNAVGIARIHEDRLRVLRQQPRTRAE